MLAGFRLEREVYVVPRQTALGFVPRANVIRPACGEHKKHFVTVGFKFFVQLCFPADFVPGIVFQNGSDSRNRAWIFPLHDLVADCTAQHVAGDVPGQGAQGKYGQREICYDCALTTHLALTNSYRSCPKLSHAQACIMR